ncbi:fimbrial protein [Pseudomonas phoenicis]|uniref:fimbrial protein n=1 Tax=unclassified Pseudomonas TaxID=196821 RepID=UPI00399FB0F9
MSTLRKLYTAITLLSLAGSAHAAIPNCRWQPAVPGPLHFEINLDETWIARDAPVGSMIGTPQYKTPPDSQGRAIRCHNDGSGTLTVQITPTQPLHSNALPPVNGWNVDGHVIETGIPGVGLYIRLGFNFEGNYSNTFTPVGDPTIPYLGHNTRDVGALPLLINYLFAHFVLIKTGPIPAGLQSFSKQVAQSQITDLGSAFDIHVRGSVQQAQCTLKANPVSADPVQLGSHDVADFTGVGSTTAATDFNITLSDCEDNPAGGIARAFIRMEGERGSVPLLPALGVFGLTSNSSASGIGIQLLRSDNSPMVLQQDEPISALTIGTTRLDFKARYYQTDPQVTAGLAEGQLKFTLSYR